MRTRWFVAGVYAYSGLHILSWWVFLNSSQNESWFRAFSSVFAWFFLPLNLSAGALCWLVWGSLNVFEARCIVNLAVDGAAASFLSASLIVGMVAWARRRRWAAV